MFLLLLIMVMLAIINLHRMRLLHNFGQGGNAKGLDGKDWEEEENQHCRNGFQYSEKLHLLESSEGLFSDN